jgi:hypothetical protein
MPDASTSRIAYWYNKSYDRAFGSLGYYKSSAEDYGEFSIRKDLT